MPFSTFRSLLFLSAFLFLAASCSKEPKQVPKDEVQQQQPVQAVVEPIVPEPLPPPPDPTKILAGTTANMLSDAEIAALAAPRMGAVWQTPYVGAIAVDAATGNVRFENNADKGCIPASMTKMMMLLIVQEAIESNKISITDIVHVSERAYKTGGSQVYLDPRESFPLEDMLYALMIQSANDAAVAIAEHLTGTCEAFVKVMNRRAERLGMKNTRFVTVHGLSGSKEMADVTTPRDMAILATELCKHEEIFRYTGESFRVFRPHSGKPFEMRTHNPLLQKKMPGCDGLKTGYTRRAGYSIAATVKRDNSRLIVVLMGCPDKATRDKELQAILSEAW